jgi:pimeloyl-ACP methyl ester carboxylesterase
MSDATAPPVVLLHGFATSAARTWGENGWLDLLRDTGRAVVAPDLPGHGTAPKPHDPAAYADLAKQVAAGLPDGPLDGVGFSLGARTLLQIAIDEPGRFRRLVLSGVGANLFRRDGSGAIAAALRGEGDTANPVARYFAGLAAHPDADPLALAALMDREDDPLTAEAVATVACPTLVVLGDADFAGPADPLMEALPDARLVTLARTDHFATPKSFAFIDAALDFLGAAPS